MFRLRSLTSSIALAVFLGIGGSAAASPIQITSGFLIVTGVQDIGSRGFLRAIIFDFSTDEFRVTGVDSDGPPQNLLAPQLAGAFTRDWTPTGGATDIVTMRSDFFVTATPSLMPTPFLLSGQLSIFDRLTGATLFSDILVGSGTANWEFVTTPTGGSVVSGVRYDFEVATVPEPATVLLLGVGLAALAVRRRNKGRA